MTGLAELPHTIEWVERSHGALENLNLKVLGDSVVPLPYAFNPSDLVRFFSTFKVNLVHKVSTKTCRQRWLEAQLGKTNKDKGSLANSVPIWKSNRADLFPSCVWPFNNQVPWRSRVISMGICFWREIWATLIQQRCNEKKAFGMPLTFHLSGVGLTLLLLQSKHLANFIE